MINSSGLHSSPPHVRPHCDLSAANNHPELGEIVELLIAQAQVVVTARQIRGLEHDFRGHVVRFPRENVSLVDRYNVDGHDSWLSPRGGTSLTRRSVTPC
ncbi:hypothetical protein BC567DRAFT_223741 [Phyllosticta citribraziliensis]